MKHDECQKKKEKKSATFWGKVVLFLHVDNGIEPVSPSFKEPIKEQKLYSA